MSTETTFESALTAFVAAAQAKVDAHLTGGVMGRKLVTVPGTKYVRVVAKDVWQGEVREESGSAYCFVEKATGNVLKAASFAKPAKGVRSNIYAADHGASGVTPHGAVYFVR